MKQFICNNFETSLMNALRNLRRIPGILSVGLFGKTAKQLSAGELEGIKNGDSDVDLFLIVKEKTLQLQQNILQKLSRFGNIDFHPHLYPIRPPDKLTIEIIAVPERTRYFIKKERGALLGLAILDSYVHLAGTTPTKVIGFIKTPKTPQQRSRYFIAGHHGLVNLLSDLWPTLSKDVKTVNIDSRRLFHIVSKNLAWVISGKFSKNDEEAAKIIKNWNIRFFNSFKPLCLLSKKQGISAKDNLVLLKKEYEIFSQLYNILGVRK